MSKVQLPDIPRPEYPRPQLVRSTWMNLNGWWDFEFDFGKSGRARELFLGDGFSRKILVPFCPESELSGIGYKDFMNAVWYKREFTLDSQWKNKRIKIHFGAVDYHAEVWINGQSAGKHSGGYSSFSFEITSLVREGVNTLVVCAEDNNRSGLQPCGKQSGSYFSHGCHYTRTTGIWQTVWLEALPSTYISSLRLTPDLENGKITIDGKIDGDGTGMTISAAASYRGMDMGRVDVLPSGNRFSTSIKLNQIHSWEPGNPRLYDLKLILSTEEGLMDEIDSYFGLRSVYLKEGAVYFNGRPLFQRLVLDQGYYPDGIYTAPSDQALRKDIEISQGLGFNGARLHQKVFEPRFLYWADRMGYIVWGEHASWGLNLSHPSALERFLPEWIEIVERDYNHPSIVGWCPFNETNAQQNTEVLRIVYQVTKNMDATRPVIDTSGYVHVITDIFSIHNYIQDPEAFKKQNERILAGEKQNKTWPDYHQYRGEPFSVAEYGGIWWNLDPNDTKGWGYGERPADENEFIERYRKLTESLLHNPKICAFCYTQLYDIEQEVNGLYTYDRIPKFDPDIFKRINTQKAAIER
jgi:beta-galactosidase/beta-glucuronidase